MKGTDHFSEGVSAAFLMWGGFAVFAGAVLAVNAVMWAFGAAELAYWHYPSLGIALLLAGLEAPEGFFRTRAAGNMHPQAATRPRRRCGDDCGDDK